MRSSSVVLAALVAGCSEKWSATDDVEAAFTGPGVFGVAVTVTPEAWPENADHGAVRAEFQGDGTLASLDTDRDILQGSPGWVNVRDAFVDCDPSTVCERTFWFEVSCEGGCAGVVSVDAFISEETWKNVDIADGALRLVLIDEAGERLPDQGPVGATAE